MFDKLYLEFGGKLFDDFHAARVLPGFRAGVKTEMLMKLRENAEIIFCISARDIEKKRIRADYGISYDAEVLRLIEKFKNLGISTCAVVITLFSGEKSAEKFARALKSRKIKTYFHTFTKGYPTNVNEIVSAKGYGAQAFVETTKPLVIVSAPGANSGKLATCLAQIYHENLRGVKAGYAKFETFPVWNLPLKHPVNVAYEAATADIGDKNMIDNFYLEKYGGSAVNYNRDLEVFPILKNILHKITGRDIYFSPTDMGVNVIGECIIDDFLARESAKSEIIRRYLNALCDFKNGISGFSVAEKIKLLLDELEISVNDRAVLGAAARAKLRKKTDVVAIEIFKNAREKSSAKLDKISENSDENSAKFIVGKNGEILTASAAAVLNAVKFFAEIPDKINLISPEILAEMLNLKREIWRENRLNLPDVLAAISARAATDKNAKNALSHLKNLRNLEAHSTIILPANELDALKKLGVNITMTDEFAG